MIRVRNFFARSSTELAEEVENYIKDFKIERTQIISINFSTDRFTSYAYLTWEDNKQ